MQVVEKKNEGLEREYAITVGADEIGRKVDARLDEMRAKMKIPGFRPGRAPTSIMKQRFGKAVLGEVLEAALQEGTQQALADHNLRPAAQPKLDIKQFDDGHDLEYTVALEVLPEIQTMDFATLELERLVAKVDDDDVEETLGRMAKQFRQTEAVSDGRAAASGDVVVFDFVGRIDGEAFEGGSAEDFQLEIGSGRFIPGFEDQLVGVKAGDSRDVTVSFPADYGEATLAGKEAVFAVTVKEVREYLDTEINDEFAKTMGQESVDALREAIRTRMARDYAGVARERLKRELLDKLEAAHQFALPQSMIEAEFEAIWSQYENVRKEQGIDAEDTGKSEEELRADYRKIAERRVLLGLLLTEVGQSNNIEVTAEEVNRALFQEAQKYPGHEREIVELYQKNPQALATLRAPIFEDKVVDFIVEMAKVREREVTVEELTRLANEDRAKQDEAVAEGSETGEAKQEA